MDSFDSDSDESLLAVALGGDDRAWKALEGRFRRPLLTLARRWTREFPVDLREDVVQEVWTALVIRRETGEKPDFDPSAQTAVSYFASLVPNAAQRVRAQYRAPGTRSRSTRQDEIAPPAVAPRMGWEAPPSSTLEEAADESLQNNPEHWDSQIDLDRAIEAAEPKVATAITAIIRDGLTFAQAAKMAGMPASTFSRRLSQLRPIAA